MESLDDAPKVRCRKIKITVLVALGMFVVWAAVGVCISYSSAYALLSVLCIALTCIPLGLCHEAHEELFYEDRSLMKDILKGLGYILSVSFTTLAFALPVILMYKDAIGPDMTAWIGGIALAGGIANAIIAHGIFTGF